MKRILGLFFAFILIITTAIPLFSYAEGNYGVDLSSASYGASINPFTKATLDPGWCTCYAWGRAHEKLGASIPWVPGASDAKAWATNARNANWPVDTTPKSDSIAVWESGGGGYGHVAYVEVVENGKMYISESNYNNTMGYSEGVFDLATGYYIGTYNDSNAYSRGLPDWYIHIASTVSFDANGGIDAPADLIKVAGKITSIPSTIPRRAGYSFVHWNSSSDGGGGITLNPGDQWGGDFDIILYAIWKVDKGSEMSSGYDRVLPDGDYQITCTSNTSFYLDIDGTVSPAANGTNVAIWGSEGDNPNEYDIWTITYSNGFYSIRQKGTDMCLDVHEDNGSKIRFGTNVQVWSNESASNQLWAISKNGNGYRLQAKCSGFSLEYADGNLSNGTNVIQNPNNDSEAQRWSFFKYDPTHFSGGGGGGGGGGWGDDGVDTVTSSGGSFVFGQWEQDGDTSNEAEPLHWRLLYEEGGFKYAICDSIIEIRAFGGGLQNWERSNLRSWLNGEFYQTAFNDSEKAKIVKRDQLNLGNDFWVASDDRGTADFVFLPSQKEVLQLLPNKNDRRASPSAYARDNAKLGNDIEFVSWWLRTNGIFIGQAMTVEPNGDINTDGQYGGDKAGVRPVIWVSGAKNGSDPGGGGGGTVWDVADVPTNAASPMPTLTPVPTNYQPPIADSYATPTPPSSSAGNIAAFPQTAYTNMEKVNVRNAANGEKITRIEERGTAITVLGETADTNGTHWYSVRLSNGVEGYIRADLVSFTFDPSWKTTPAPVVSSSPFSSYLAKTTTKKVNVRTRADGESKTVTQIKDAGTVVTVIGEEYSANGVLWYAVVLADGRNGYIRSDLLERVNGNASTQSPGSMINNAYVSWQDAYGDFIQNQIFLLLDQVYYNPDEIVVAFYDFDNDSVPELMIYNGSEGAETACTYVYTFKWNNVHYIGSIGGTCRWVGDHSVFTANQKPGLYYYLYENNNTCAYYYINGNGIVAEKASLDSEIVGDAEEYIRWYSLSEIAKIGWNKFIYAPFFDTILDVDYSVPEVFFPGEPVSFEITINDGTGPFLIGYTFNSHIEENKGDHSTEIFRNNNTLSGGERIYKASFVPDNTVGELEIYIWITDYYGTTNERPEFYRLISRGERDSEQGQHTNNHQNGSGENAVLLPLSVKVTADREIITSITPVHYSIDVIGGTPPYDIVWDAYVIGVSRAEYTDGVTTDQNHIDVFYEWDAPTEGLVFQVAVYDAEHSYAIDDIVLNDSYNIEKNGTEYRAICIGENYNSIVSDVFKGISQLHGCVPDAERLSVLLSTNGGYDVQFLPNASKLSVINAIQTHFKDADENDVSLFFYSGHGYKPEMGSLVTFEGTTLDGYVFNGLSCTGSINIQELMNWLSNVKGIKIIILDSCYSGSFVQNNPYLDDSVIIMAACTNDQTAMETSAVDEGMLYGVTGVFSMYLRDGIDEMKADANNDFRISAAEIADYVNNAVNAAKYEQRCVFYNCTDDFIIVEKELPHIFR